MSAYFFFDDFLADFFAAAFFFAAIKLTTFHAVRDLTVAPTWQKTPDLSGQLTFGWGLRQGWERRRPSTLSGASRLFVQFVAIIVFLIVNMRSLSHIVKQLFMKIVIETRCSTSVPRISFVHPAAKRAGSPVRIAGVALKNRRRRGATGDPARFAAG
jgi:hypothetical protein